MKKNTILIALCCVAYVGIFSEPDINSSHWVTIFIVSKAIGALAAWAAYRLMNRRQAADRQ
ncbi:MAG: hypothetical protein HDR99_05795 [Bacteroides sp.]|nr:hypothetical protein [Bacteroides sp.]